MSTAALPGDQPIQQSDDSASDPLLAGMTRAIELLASLKLTCVLFLLGMFVVFVGSLAQARKDVWLVVHEYFRTYIAWMDVADFFPPSMFPSYVGFDWDSLGAMRYIPFPGGWTIGWIMLANLMAAHFLRFKIRATGGRFNAGITIVALGTLLTWLVVWTGNQQTGVEYGDTILSPENIWYLMLGVLGIATVVPLGMAFTKTISMPERILMISIAAVLGGVLAYFVIGGEDARLNLSSMRILWQLLKGTACAVVILIGCNLLFEKRGGIVVLHIGVALLMFSELQVGFYAKENLLALEEGQTLSFMRDVRERELAVIHRVDGKDKVVAVPEALLVEAANEDDAEDRIIDVEELPFLIRVEDFLRNSQLRPVLPGEKVATSGLGTFANAVEVDPVTGMDDSHDISSLKFEVVDRESGKPLETLLCSQNVSEMRSVPIAEQAKVDGTDYQFYLRFQRNYKDYEVELVDVSRTNYIGTSTPRDYRSQIKIRDADGSNEEEFTLWMNNPLRYKGETFYQSGYQEMPDGTEVTTLSVVRNTGWMLPYIACMIVAVGMFGQFGQTLTRYLKRFDKSSKPAAENDALSSLPEGVMKAAAPSESFEEKAESENSSIWPTLVPILVVALSAAWLGSKLRAPKATAEAMNLYGFAQLPVAWKGRAQPIDSFARTELLMASHKSTFKGELTAAELDFEDNRDKLVNRITSSWSSVSEEDLEGFSGDYDAWIKKVSKLTASSEEAVEERLRGDMVARMPAVRWFLDVVARPEAARRHRVIKIDNDQILAKLKLEQRPGLAYSVAEIQENMSELEKIHREGLKKQMAEQEHRMSQLERRVVKLFQTVGRIDSLQNVFLTRDSDGLMDSLVTSWWVLDRLGNKPAIMAVPTGSENEQRSWETLIASNSIRNLRAELSAAGLEDADQVVAYIKDELPLKLVTRDDVRDSIEGSLQILKSTLAETSECEVTDEALKSRALGGAAAIEDPYLSKVLSLIGNAEAGASVDDMLAGVTDEDLKKLATHRISSDVFRIFEALQEKPGDKRLAQVRASLRESGVSGEAELANMMTQELVKICLDDLDKRIGPLLFEDAEAFDTGSEALTGMLTAWSEGDVDAFNSGVTGYQEYLAAKPLEHVDASVVSEEAFFNFYEPFMKAIYLYLPVLLLGFLSWIVWPTTLRRTAFSLMLLAFVVHTGALLMRMHISGRPPVTNLYSSAIFIGWAVVLAAFVVEMIIGASIGNILGATAGMGTLMIAHYLARDEGDTLGVMQAVLDTTFWLATHVVCITLGYAATFLAGLLGMVYVILRIATSGSDNDSVSQGTANRVAFLVALLAAPLAGIILRVTAQVEAKNGRVRLTDAIGKTIYGVLCFALFFSLVGTVLGGLWADDSWGRFWGWDPKENGAMLIVMWNALILHARWDKMVRDYGTAVLSMFGNIVTAWSWFGVNELKAGLHSYGFTDGRLMALLIFMLIQAIIIVGAMIPVIGRKANQTIEPA